jgi:amino acid permease
MVNTDRIAELAPHYLAMLLFVFLVLNVVRVLFGAVDFWTELVIIVAIVFAYRPIVLRLGVAPSSWEEQARQGD